MDADDITAAVLAATGVLLLVSSLLSRVGSRFGVPVGLLFLGIGMLAGSDGPGGIWFDDYEIAYGVGTTALVLILFAGGLNTETAHVRRALAPAGVLATVGVLGVAGMAAFGAHGLGLTWGEALLVGAIVSSTDASSVFAMLQGVPLRRRVALTLELESGLNDPVAVILTVGTSLAFCGKGGLGWDLLGQMAIQLAVGAVVGGAMGVGARWLLAHVRLSTPALLPTLTIGVAFIAYGVAAQLNGSGFLAVYVAGMLLGQGELPYKLNLQRFHDALSWVAQVGMFLMLGMLVFPSQLLKVAVPGMALALWLAFVARPLVVTLCLLPFGFQWREILCVAWLGLRGAVPIILATVPVLMLDDPALAPNDIVEQFNLIFFVVVVGSIIPGMTVRHLPRWLGLEEAVPPEPSASIDITSELPLQDAQLTLFIGPDSPAVGRVLGDLPLPPDASVMLIVRGARLIPPRGATRFEVGDHAFVLCPRDHAASVHAVFGA
ncbi:MAG: potassium/proton antiporter [bacterium]